MKRALQILIVLIGLLGPTFAGAMTIEEKVIASLRAEGYVEIVVSRTFLGRLRFVASGENGVREIIVQASNGEILRDRITRPVVATAISRSGSSGSSGPSSPVPTPGGGSVITTPPSGSGGGTTSGSGSSSGSSDDREDDDKEDDDKEDDDKDDDKDDDDKDEEDDDDRGRGRGRGGDD